MFHLESRSLLGYNSTQDASRDSKDNEDQFIGFITNIWVYVGIGVILVALSLAVFVILRKWKNLKSEDATRTISHVMAPSHTFQHSDEPEIVVKDDQVVSYKHETNLAPPPPRTRPQGEDDAYATVARVGEISRRTTRLDSEDLYQPHKPDSTMAATDTSRYETYATSADKTEHRRRLQNDETLIMVQGEPSTISKLYAQMSRRRMLSAEEKQIETEIIFETDEDCAAFQAYDDWIYGIENEDLRLKMWIFKQQEPHLALSIWKDCRKRQLSHAKVIERYVQQAHLFETPQ